ncbi:MAG: hypothetical protein R3248_12420 [Candidatus Promineifilaceae bacterium]|nr:hypothetical protein [Candidatus Promineifilaceae bacterium]
MTTRRLFVFLFVIALFAMAVRETLDPDMWWHLRTGEVILADGLPRYDVFSFTVPDHRWITHEWLSQVWMWIVYVAGGFTGLMVVFAAIVALTFWLVYRRTPGRPYLAAFVVLLAAIASAITWGARPQIFNLLLLAAFIYVVEGVRGGQLRARYLWLLPPLTALWVNLHSGYLLGVVLLATYVVGETLQAWLGPAGEPTLSTRQIRLLAAVTGVSFLAALLNPNGYHLWIYPFETLGSSAMQSYIQEWQPPDFHFAIFWPFAAMLALGVTGWVYSPRRPSFTDVLLFLGTGGAGLLSARHIPLFAIVAAPIVARSWWSVLAGTRVEGWLAPGTERPPGRLARILNWSLLLLALLAAAAWVGVKAGGNDEAIADRYPVAAVDFLEQSGLDQERGYNRYGWGGYLIWRGIPVFVDGRADVYGDDFLLYYRQTLELQDDWREPLNEFNVTYALLGKNSALATLLATSDGWQERYTDDQAAIFVRAGRN